jgi:hypothetical protein
MIYNIQTNLTMPLGADTRNEKNELTNHTQTRN